MTEHVTGETVMLAVTGMSCGSCRRHVEEALRSVEGVQGAEVDLSVSRAVVRLAVEGAPVEALVAAVREAGYGAQQVAGTGRTTDR